MTQLSDAALSHLRHLDPDTPVGNDRYQFVEELGRGGMGVVFRVHDRELGREVALKIVGSESGAGTPERLAREARALARIEHPGIVPVHDVGTLPDGRLFYVMKLVRGVRLDARLSGGIALGEGLRIIARLCDAVAFAHSRGVIHRDLKPQNVMLGPFGEVLILDWGVAKLRDDLGAVEPSRVGPVTVPALSPTTLDGVVLGTPGYMAPEQAMGGAVDERADVYALGVMLSDVVSAPGTGSAPLPLRSIVAKAAAPAPQDRYENAAAMSQDIAAWLDGQRVSAHRETGVERVVRVAKRHRTALALIGVYIVVRLVLLWVTAARRT